MLIERVRTGRSSTDAPVPAFNRALTLLLVAVGWVMFRAADVNTALDFYKAMINPFARRGDRPREPRRWAAATCSPCCWAAPSSSCPATS